MLFLLSLVLFLLIVHRQNGEDLLEEVNEVEKEMHGVDHVVVVAIHVLLDDELGVVEDKAERHGGGDVEVELEGGERVDADEETHQQQHRHAAQNTSEVEIGASLSKQSTDGETGKDSRCSGKGRHHDSWVDAND